MRFSNTILVVLVCLALTPAAINAAERSVPEVYSPGEETLFVLEHNGKRLGYNWSRYEGKLDFGGIEAHRFRSQVSVEAAVPGGTTVQRFTSDVLVDGSGHPLRVDFRAEVYGVKVGVELTFSDDKAQAVVFQGGAEQQLELAVEADAYLLASNFISDLDLMLALAAPAGGDRGSYRMFSTNSLKGFELGLEPLTDRDGRVFRDSLGEVIHLDESGRLELLELPAQKVVFRRVDEEVEPFWIGHPSYVWDTSGMDLEEVHISYGDVSLAGTITRPAGSSGRLPAVTFVSGSGGQDRNGFSGGVDLGTHAILDRLTRAGFLVLRVDDRGVGASLGPTDGMTYDDLVEDARQCVLFLQSRPDVDSSRIAVIGHSEGGETVPILAADMDLAAISLMAPPGRNIIEMLHEQIRRSRESQGETEEQLAAFDRAFEDFKTRIVEGTTIDGDTLPPELGAFLPQREWLKSHATKDPVATLKKVHSPVLLLQGARDVQVIADRDTPLLEAALEASGNADFTVVIFPELDHLFKKTEGGASSVTDYLKKRSIDPEFLDVLVDWLSARLLKGGAGG